MGVVGCWRMAKDSVDYKEMDFIEIRSGRPKYRLLIAEAKKLKLDRMIVVEGWTYSQLAYLRRKVERTLGKDWEVAAWKMEGAKFKDRYTVYVFRSEAPRVYRKRRGKRW